MLESELFELLENTADAAYTVTDDGEICSWNAAAERLFGLSPGEVLHRNIVEVMDGFDVLGTDPLAGGQGAAIRRWKGGAGGIENFDLEVRIRDGGRVWVNVSTIVFDNKRTKRRLFVRLARDISPRRRQEEMLGRMVEIARQVVSLDKSHGHAPADTLSAQERRILMLLADGTSTASVADKLRISPQTLRNHLHHINRKLRTRNRLEAVTHAQRRGLLG